MRAQNIILSLLLPSVDIRFNAVLGGDIPIAHAHEAADDKFVTSPSASARLPLRLESTTLSEVPKMRASVKSKRLNEALGQGRHTTDLTNFVTVPKITNEQQYHRRAKKGKALKVKGSKGPKSKKSKPALTPSQTPTDGESPSNSANIEISDSRTWFELMDEYEQLYNARLETQSAQQRLEQELGRQQERLNKLEQDTYDITRRRLEVSNAAPTAAPDPGCDQNAQCSRIIGAINLVQGVVGALIFISDCFFNKEKKTEAELKVCEDNWVANILILARAGVTILSFFTGPFAIFVVVAIELAAVLYDIHTALKDSKEPVVSLTNAEMLAEIARRTKTNNAIITDKTLEAKLALEVSDLETWRASMLTFNRMFSSEIVGDITFDINDAVEALFRDVSTFNFGDLLWDTQKDIERVFFWFTKPDTEYARHQFFLSHEMFKPGCKDGPCGRGAVNSLVRGDYNQARTCLTNNQVVIETIPPYFQGISAVADYISIHNNLILQSKNAVENIRTITAFADDERLRNFNEMVTCRSRNILMIIEKLEDRKQMHVDHCMTLDEILPNNNKNEPFDFNLPRNFDMMPIRQNGIALRLAQNTIGWGDTAGALVQTCTKNGKCNFPYLLGRCFGERLEGNAALVISGGTDKVPDLRRETCDVENNRLSWSEVRWSSAPDGSGYWQDCLVTFQAGSGNNPPAMEQGCSCGKVIDQCERIGFCWVCDNKDDWLKEPAYVYALPEYCMQSQITSPNGWPSREETCYNEMSDNSKWMIQPERCRVDLVGP